MQYQTQKLIPVKTDITPNPIPKTVEAYTSLTEEIHHRAIQASQQFLHAESQLIEILQQVDQHRVYIEYGHSSLFHYVTQELKISESVAYNLITVSRKAREVPALKSAIQNQQITLSNARKLTPILNQTNQEHWISKAQTLSSRQLEKEIARENPKLATPEKVTYATAERVQLTLGLSEKDMLQLRRVQDLLCKARQSPVTLEDTLVAMTEEFLTRKDPIKKAKRVIAKKGSIPTPSDRSTDRIQSPVARQEVDSSSFKIKVQNEKTTSTLDHPLRGPSSVASPSAWPSLNHTRIPIPAHITHQVWLRDEGRCTHLNHEGVRCRNTRYIEIHHIQPVASGGGNALTNLTTLCTSHHRHLHARS